MKRMRMFVKVMSKEVEVAPNVVKTVHYGFRKVLNSDGEYVDVEPVPYTDKDGKPALRIIGFKIKLTDYFLNKHEDLHFPVILDVDLSKKLEEDNTKSWAFITKDKKADKTVRLDKNGNSHALLVINEVVNIIECPFEDYSFDDIDKLG